MHVIAKNKFQVIVKVILKKYVIEDSDNLIVFPTTSPSSDDCAWISLKRVKKIEKLEFNNTKIIFDNDREIVVNCSYRSIENQLSRASRLDIILRNHKNS